MYNENNSGKHYIPAHHRRRAKRRKQQSLIIATVATICSIIACATIAFVFTNTEPLKNTFTDAYVACDVLETFDGTTKSDVTVKNTGEVQSYIRAKLMDFVTKHLDDKFYLEGSQRIDVRNKIFREICANMLIHREFSSAYPAKFIIEKDTVRTENANKPNGYGAIDALSFSPYPKNPNIARFFREIGLADELGSGVKNVNHYLKIYSGGSPEFIEGDVFKQVIPIAEKGYKIQDRVQDRIQDNKQGTVYIKVIEFCSEAKSTSEIMDFLGLKSRPSFKKRILDPMLQSGLIVMTMPDKPTSRNQRYVVKK